MVCLLFVLMVTLSVAPAADRISLPQLAREQGVSPVSTWRWALRGCRGIVLPTFCVGHKRYTTRAAFAEWCAHVTAAAKVEDNGAAAVVKGVVNGKFAVSDAANVVELPKEVQETIAEQALANGATLTETKRLREGPSRSGKEILPTKLRKEAIAAFGKLTRALDRLGLDNQCGEHLDAILAAIESCEDVIADTVKAPF